MKIGLICAVEKEIWVLRENLKEKYTIEKAGNIIHVCEIGNNEVAFMMCGVGKVSASIAAQTLIDTFEPDAIINSGNGGALSHKLDVGDIVLSTACAEHDIRVLGLGHRPGYVFSLDTVEMKADDKLRNMIKNAIPKDVNVYEGLIVSGDQFIDTNEKRQFILDAFPNALVAEMEGASIAHTCMQNKVPFCVVRCISDNADGNSGVDYWEFAPKTGERSAKIMLKVLDKI